MYLKLASTSCLAAAVGLVGLAVIPHVDAKCGCPDDGIGARAAASGLGQEFPVASDLAADSAWQVYEFERDGIRYTQVNDQYGKVRAAVGRIGDTLWTMPIGSDVDRVFINGDGTLAGVPKVLYRTSQVEVVLYQDGAQQRWLIRAPSSR